MTLDQFCAITASRIPTPAEFLSFAESQGWRVREGKLHADRNDPLAVAFAKMLSREPYRTNVVKLIRERGPQEDRPSRKPEPKAEPEPEPERCRLCDRTVTDPEDRERLREVNPFCNRGQARAATDGNGVHHSAQEGCPFRGRDS